MTANLKKLLNYLEVERVDKYIFIGKSPRRPPRVFGGQVLAQSLNAALRTVDSDRIAHSLHAYFLRPGDPARQIVYEVDPIRDGRSFTTRRVVAKQEGVAIFSTAVSLQVEEPGLSHQFDPPKVTPPEELEPDHEFWARTLKNNPDKLQFHAPQQLPIERRPVRRRDYFDPQPTEPVQHIWFRVMGDPGDDHRMHQTLLAYMSDFALLGTALMPHPYSGMSKNLQSASLDHALWFHRPFRADEYLLYSLDSPSAAAGRGFSRGSFFTRNGELVASTAQESLIRPIDD